MKYYEIEKKSTLQKDLIDYAQVSGAWLKYYNFDIRPIPQEILNKDPFFQWLSKNYKYFAAILKLDPYVCYDWHKDTKRGVSINMLLTPEARSICMFTDSKEGVVFKTEELIYKPETYYIFNTQVFHTVFNFETERYLLSVEFELDKDSLTFEDLIKEIKDKYEKNS